MGEGALNRCEKHGCALQVAEAIGWADTEYCPVCSAEARLAEALGECTKAAERVEQAAQQLVQAIQNAEGMNDEYGNC